MSSDTQARKKQKPAKTNGKKNKTSMVN